MRDEAIDSLRGFLIVCVVLGHYNLYLFVQNYSPPYVREQFFNSAWYIIWSYLIGCVNIYYFHMPLFLGISVLFVKKFSLRYALSRAIRILLPYVFWYLIEDYLLHSLLHPFYVLVKEPVKFSLGQVKLFAFMLLAKIRILVNGNYLLSRSPLWFFPALFITNIGYSIYRLYDRRSLEVCKYLNYSPAVVVLLLWVWMFTKIQRIAILHAFGIIPFGIDIVFYLLPFFIVLDSVYKNRVAMCRIHLLIYIIIIIISINLISYFEPLKTHVPIIRRIDLAVLSVPNTMIGFIAMCTLSAGIMMLFLKLGRVKFFIYLGTYSLPIFVLHRVVALRVNIVLSHLMELFNFNDTLVFLIYLLSIMLSIFIPIIISKGLMKILPVFRYFGMVA